MVLTGEAQIGHKRKVFAKKVVHPGMVHWDFYPWSFPRLSPPQARLPCPGIAHCLAQQDRGPPDIPSYQHCSVMWLHHPHPPPAPTGAELSPAHGSHPSSTSPGTSTPTCNRQPGRQEPAPSPGEPAWAQGGDERRQGSLHPGTSELSVSPPLPSPSHRPQPQGTPWEQQCQPELSQPQQPQQQLLSLCHLRGTRHPGTGSR